MTRIKYKNGVDIHINKDYQKSLKDCEKLSITFKNQNQIQLSLEIFDNYTNIKSIFNTEVKKVFYEFKKSPFTHTFYKPTTYANLKCIDIKKCFSACLSTKNEYPFLIYSIFDEIELYNGILTNGTYYVETEGFFPLKGNGWYFRSELDEAKCLGIDFKIIYQIIPSRTLPKDYFHDLVHKVFEHCKEPKHIMNCLIGCLNKKETISESERYTSDLNDAVRIQITLHNLWLQLNNLQICFHEAI